MDLVYAQSHGNAGMVPHNITPNSIVDKIVTVMDLYCRTDPTSDQLISCNENFAGVAGLLLAIALEESSTYELICDTTVTRVIARVLRDRGLRDICMSSPDHNVSCICKELVGIINQAHIAQQRLSQDTTTAVVLGATCAPPPPQLIFEAQPTLFGAPTPTPLPTPLGAPPPPPQLIFEAQPPLFGAPMPTPLTTPLGAPPPPPQLIFEALSRTRTRTL